MNLNEDSIKQLDETTNKNYYFRIDEENRLTLELTEDLPLHECVALTVACMNEMNSKL